MRLGHSCFYVLDVLTRLQFSALYFFGQSRFLVLVRIGHSRFQFWDRCQRLHALALDRFGHLRIRKLTDGILLRNDGSP